jgi:hypothetical protein
MENETDRQSAAHRLATSTTNSKPTAMQRLKPATADERQRHLIVTLNVVSPLLTDQQKLDWVRAVSSDLRDIPEELLAIGAKEARMYCSYPGQIVPKIMETVGPTLASLRRMTKADERVPRDRHIEPHYVDRQTAAEILEKHGLTIPQALKREPPRMPTPADYLAMGINIPDQASEK